MKKSTTKGKKVVTTTTTKTAVTFPILVSQVHFSVNSRDSSEGNTSIRF